MTAIKLFTAEFGQSNSDNTRQKSASWITGVRKKLKSRLKTSVQLQNMALLTRDFFLQHENSTDHSDTETNENETGKKKID